MSALRIFCCVLLISVTASAKNHQKHDYVPDSTTAINIGRRKLTRIYGKKSIQAEEPLKAGVQNGIWTVSGTLWCSDGKGGRTNNCVGGVASIRMRQSDGKVLSILHTK